MKKSVYLFCAYLIVLASVSYAKQDTKPSHQEEIKAFLKEIFSSNVTHVESLSHEHFQSFAEQQNPRGTVVTCSDSRIQSNAYHKSPINDLFYIRNIGNQIITTEGSVEYGIYHLHTPVLLIIGHSNCGAIHAALSDYSAESHAIQSELDHLHLKKGNDVNAGVVENINNQVRYALNKFKDKIANQELVVVGAIYDFRDDFKHGHGRLILINLNGEQDPQKIKKNDVIKDIKEIYIGEG